MSQRTEERPLPELPMSIVTKLFRSQMPNTASVSGDCKPVLSQAASLFVMYVSATARDFASRQGRQNVLAKDIIAAMEELEFPEFIPDITSTLEAYKRDMGARKVQKAASKQTEEEEDQEQQDDDGQGEDQEQSEPMEIDGEEGEELEEEEEEEA